MLNNDRDPLLLKGFPKGLNPPVPHITVPSIVGSGAEISFNAVFIDDIKGQKLGINSKNNFPLKTIYDPLLISTAPRGAIVSSAFDTLVHCVDSFGSKKSSDLTRILSIEGFKRTFSVLFNNALNDTSKIKDLCIGSALGITALMNSGDGPTNGFAYYFGVKHKVPHGIAGAMFLFEVMKYNYSRGYKDYPMLNFYGGDTQDLFDKMKIIYKRYEIPNLSKFNYTHQMIEEMAELSAESLSGSFSGNPLTFNHKSALTVLKNLI